MSDDDAHFRLRIPRHLKEWVEKNAKANNRSINAEILSCIELAQNGIAMNDGDAKELMDKMIREALAPVQEKFEKDVLRLKDELEAFMASKK